MKELIKYGHGIVNVVEVARKAASSNKLEDIKHGVSLFKLIAEKDTTYTAEYEDFKKVLTEKKPVVQKTAVKRRR